MTDAAPLSRILTLVFTDLADSTALKTQQGDRRVGELIARHQALVDTYAADSAGRVINWAGDGCFLTFETPTAAVLFALRLQQVHRDEPELPGVRTGIHMGEVSEWPAPDGDAGRPRVEGLAVDLAARICGLARPGQVLMSAAVADSARQRLAAASFSRPVRWRAHGSYALEGFDEAVQIREAGSRGRGAVRGTGGGREGTAGATGCVDDEGTAGVAGRRRVGGCPGRFGHRPPFVARPPRPSACGPPTPRRDDAGERSTRRARLRHPARHRGAAVRQPLRRPSAGILRRRPG